MRTISTQAEIDAKGWLKVRTRAPKGLPPGVVRAVIVLDASEKVPSQRQPLPVETPEQMAKRVEAMTRLAAMGGIPEIPDPVAWQREIRKDRPLPGRD